MNILDGNFSVLTGNSPGCHGEHSKNYIRRVQVNKEEEAGLIYKEVNPKAVVESVWSNGGTDYCIMFPITPKTGTILKKDLLGTNQLEVVKLLQNSWVRGGKRNLKDKVENNVSNTVQVPNGEWEEVAEFVWQNRFDLAGVSFIPSSGDLDFNQMPYTEVLMPNELLETYGEGVIFASGLIVDCVNIFGDLWKACEAYFGRGEKLTTTYEDAKQFLNNFDEAKPKDFLNKTHGEFIEAKNKQYSKWVDLYMAMGYSQEFAEQLLDNEIEVPLNEIQKYLDKKMFGSVFKLSEKRDILRRLNKFACKYFNCDDNLAIQALKHVQLFHTWCEITYTYQEVDWTKVKWERVLIDADSTGAQGCSGGACEIKSI